MSHSTPLIDPLAILKTLVAHRWRCVLPAMLCAGLATSYAAVRPTVWQASQQLTLRDEATGSLRAGRFVDADSMKHAQETVFEVARSEPVLREALEQVGAPPGTWFVSSWPSNEDVAALQESLSVSAPNGAEFGKTEVFYLRVKGKSQSRAIELTSAVCDVLEKHLRELRQSKAKSLKEEMERTVQLAREELQVVTEKVSTLENEVGRDLAELRNLSQASGEGNLRQTLVSVRNDLRQQELAQRSKMELMAQLVAARANPSQFVATPNELLESQPALRRLKDGLVDSQLQSSNLMSQMSPDHPRVRAALEAQNEIRTRLFNELESSVRGLQTELDTNQARIQSLEQQTTEMENRLGKLAQLRVTYTNLTSALDRRNEILKKSEETLADARASLAAADSASLITRLGDPVTGNHPIGPGRVSIVLAGIVGGLALGLGLVFLTAPFPMTNPGARPVGPADVKENAAAHAIHRSFNTRQEDFVTNDRRSPTAEKYQERRAALPANSQRSDATPDAERYASFVLSKEPPAELSQPTHDSDPFTGIIAAPSLAKPAAGTANTVNPAATSESSAIASTVGSAPSADSAARKVSTSKSVGDSKKPIPSTEKAGEPKRGDAPTHSVGGQTKKNAELELDATADIRTTYVIPSRKTESVAPAATANEPPTSNPVESVAASSAGDSDPWGFASAKAASFAADDAWIASGETPLNLGLPSASVPLSLDASLSPKGDGDSLGNALSRLTFGANQAG